MNPTIRSFKVYMPAKDFERSKRFYAALGFAVWEGSSGTADFSMNGHAFRLQDDYVKDWADNFMAVLGVDDVEAWHRRVVEVANDPDFRDVRVKPPEPVGDSMVLHVCDPSGVLLVFVQ